MDRPKHIVDSYYFIVERYICLSLIKDSFSSTDINARLIILEVFWIRSAGRRWHFPSIKNFM